jgi:hypothetical protein
MHIHIFMYFLTNWGFCHLQRVAARNDKSKNYNCTKVGKEKFRNSCYLVMNESVKLVSGLYWEFKTCT